MSNDSLEEFSKLCKRVAEETSYLNKAQVLAEFFKCNRGNKAFEGDLLLWLRFLIPSDSQRVYNLQNKQMIKLFSRLFKADSLLMQEDLEQGRNSIFVAQISVIISCFILMQVAIFRKQLKSSLKNRRLWNLSRKVLCHWKKWTTSSYSLANAPKKMNNLNCYKKYVKNVQRRT